MSFFPKDIPITEFDYLLPDEFVPKFPLQDRSASKILCYSKGTIIDNHFYNLPEILNDNQVLVFNNTKVVKARLFFQTKTKAKLEIFCLEPFEESFEHAMLHKGKSVWVCLVGNAQKWKGDEVVSIDFEHENKMLKFSASLTKNLGNERLVTFTWNDLSMSFSEILEYLGRIPLPTYFDRKDEASDSENYQTCYAQVEGSVAAPTAGLHFTQELIDNIHKKNITQLTLTLHVGLGTFMPVRTDSVKEHNMHAEQFFISLETLEKLIESKQNGKEIIAVGTTSCRTLESLYWLGFKIYKDKNVLPEALFIDQWEPYAYMDEVFDVITALKLLHQYMIEHTINSLNGRTQIIIVPGYRFKIINGLITNFHLPKSTLILLVSALIGADWKKVYNHALQNNYRFLSYGDSSILMA